MSVIGNLNMVLLMTGDFMSEIGAFYDVMHTLT